MTPKAVTGLQLRDAAWGENGGKKSKKDQTELVQNEFRKVKQKQRKRSSYLVSSGTVTVVSEIPKNSIPNKKLQP